LGFTFLVVIRVVPMADFVFSRSTIFQNHLSFLLASYWEQLFFISGLGLVYFYGFLLHLRFISMVFDRDGIFLFDSVRTS
jgi:hypothetical protein